MSSLSLKSTIARRSLPAPPALRRPRRAIAARGVGRLAGDVDTLITGEWPSYVVGRALSGLEEHNALEEKRAPKPAHRARSFMSTTVTAAHPEDTVAAVVDRALSHVSGVPVIDEAGTLVGVFSKHDVARAGGAASTTRVGDAMSSPAITITPATTAAQAAALCLKHKVHRLPVVDRKGAVVGMVTRTDLFHVLADDA